MARPTAVTPPVLGPADVLDQAAAMAGLRAGEVPVGFHQLRAVPGGLVAQLPADLGQSRVGQSPAPHPRPGQSLLAQHAGGVQPFHHDPAVGLGQPGGEPMDLVPSDGGDMGLEPGAAPLLAPAAIRAALAPGDGPREPTQHGQVPGQRGRVGHPLDDSLGGGHRGQPAHADIDPDRRGRIRVATLRGSPRGWPRGAPLRPLDLDPEDHHRPLPDPLQGGGEDARPAQANQPLQPAGALARAHGADLGQGDVAAIGLDPNHPGAEGAAVRVSALALEPREADPATVEFARPGLLPAPVGIHRILDAVGEGLFGDLGPPGLAGLPIHALGGLGPVPAPAETVERRRLLRLTGLGLPTKGLPIGTGSDGVPKLASWGTPLPVGVEIGFEGPDRPVVGVAPPAPLPSDDLPLLRRGVQGELERLQRPAVRGRVPTGLPTRLAWGPHRDSSRGTPSELAPMGTPRWGTPSWGTPTGHRAGALPSPSPRDGRPSAGRRAGRRGWSGSRSRLGPGHRLLDHDGGHGRVTQPSQELPTLSVQGRANLGHDPPDGEPLLGCPSGDTRHLSIQIGALIGRGHASGRSRRPGTAPGRPPGSGDRLAWSGREACPTGGSGRRSRGGCPARAPTASSSQRPTIAHEHDSSCQPSSLAQEVGLGLGAQAGEGRLREAAEEAGFRRFRRAAATPFNLVLEIRP